MTKRLFDIVVAALLLAVLSPVLLALAGAIWVIDGKPILFKQRRLGYRGSPFTVLKFRTMAEPIAGDASPDAQRTTRFGSR